MARRATRIDAPLGAYGLRLTGLDRESLVEADATWPLLDIHRRHGRATAKRDSLTDDQATIVLHNGGSIEIRRDPLSARFTMPHELRDVEIAHPLLAPAAAIANRWCGREAFHAGGFEIGGRAFGVLGGRASGKSSLLAWLALTGVSVVCDDVLVTDSADAYAGPRFVDLRRDGATFLQAGQNLGVIGARERWRLRVDAVPARVPLAGWIFLEWGTDCSMSTAGVGERLLRIGASRSVNRPPRDPLVMLRLSALPGWVVRRPRAWDALEQAADRVLDAVTA